MAYLGGYIAVDLTYKHVHTLFLLYFLEGELYLVLMLDFHIKRSIFSPRSNPLKRQAWHPQISRCLLDNIASGKRGRGSQRQKEIQIVI